MTRRNRNPARNDRLGIFGTGDNQTPDGSFFGFGASRSAPCRHRPTIMPAMEIAAIGPAAENTDEMVMVAK